MVYVFVLVNMGWSASAQERLQVGENAPALTVKEWIKNKPNRDVQQTGRYIVEFSGTWCAPCMKAMPHISELYAKYGDRIPIVSVFCDADSDPLDLSYISKIKYLVNDLGAKINYSVCADEPAQTTQKSWKISAFPTAFLIDSGKVAWIGNPLELDTVLQKLCNGDFDAKTAQTENEQFDKVIRSIREKSADGFYLQAVKNIDSLIALYPERPYLYYLKFLAFAGHDDRRAYDVVQLLVDRDMKQFDWPHFISEFYQIGRGNRNFPLEMKAINLAISRSEIECLEAFPLSMKAITYALMNNYISAAETISMAVEKSALPGGYREETDYYKQLFKIYTYKSKNNKQAAKKYLIDNVSDSDCMAEWKALIGAAERMATYGGGTVITADHERTSREDYSLALELIDLALQDKRNNPARTIWLKKKALLKQKDGNI